MKYQAFDPKTEECYTTNRRARAVSRARTFARKHGLSFVYCLGRSTTGPLDELVGQIIIEASGPGAFATHTGGKTQ